MRDNEGLGEAGTSVDFPLENCFVYFGFLMEIKLIYLLSSFFLV